MKIVNKKPGRIYGAITFYNLIISIIVTYIIILVKKEMPITELIKLVSLSFGLFTIVWGAVWGKDVIKYTKEKKE
jgi:hypothetical protein